MEDVKFKTDHDILVTLVSEVKQARVDIREIRDGSAFNIGDHTKRIEALERWREAQLAYSNSQSVLIKILIAIGIILLGMLVYHLTGYKI